MFRSDNEWINSIRRSWVYRGRKSGDSRVVGKAPHISEPNMERVDNEWREKIGKLICAFHRRSHIDGGRHYVCRNNIGVRSRLSHRIGL